MDFRFSSKCLCINLGFAEFVALENALYFFMDVCAEVRQ